MAPAHVSSPVPTSLVLFSSTSFESFCIARVFNLFESWY